MSISFRGLKGHSFLFACSASLFSVSARADPASRLAAGDWPVYGGGLGSARYSPLDQIDPSNVAELEIAWRWSAANFGPEPELNYRATPIMIDGVLYVTAGTRRAVVAIDAVTGETLWVHRVDEGERAAQAPRINSGRGVAFWESADRSAQRVFTITPGYHLIALDTDTGRPAPGFGRNGVVDWMETLRVPEGVSPIGTIGSSSPPIIVGDVVIIGSAHVSGRSQPVPENIPGDIRGFDARTGEHLWSASTSCRGTASSAPRTSTALEVRWRTASRSAS